MQAVVRERRGGILASAPSHVSVFINHATLGNSPPKWAGNTSHGRAQTPRTSANGVVLGPNAAAAHLHSRIPHRTCPVGPICTASPRDPDAPYKCRPADGGAHPICVSRAPAPRPPADTRPGTMVSGSATASRHGSGACTRRTSSHPRFQGRDPSAPRPLPLSAHVLRKTAAGYAVTSVPTYVGLVASVAGRPHDAVGGFARERPREKKGMWHKIKAALVRGALPRNRHALTRSSGRPASVTPRSPDGRQDVRTRRRCMRRVVR
jgi:hypothetical protein